MKDSHNISKKRQPHRTGRTNSSDWGWAWERKIDLLKRLKQESEEKQSTPRFIITSTVWKVITWTPWPQNMTQTSYSIKSWGWPLSFLKGCPGYLYQSLTFSLWGGMVIWSSLQSPSLPASNNLCLLAKWLCQAKGLQRICEKICGLPCRAIT